VGLAFIYSLNKGEALISIRATYGTYMLLVASKFSGA